MRHDSDSYADSAEVEAVDALRQQQHGEAEYFNAVTAGSTGQAYPDDPFYGTDPADVKARRHARGWVAREDYEPKPLDPVDTYQGPTTGAEVGTQEEAAAYARYQEDLAREKYPLYDQIIDRYVIPKLKEEGVDPQQLQEWVLQHDDFAEKAYQAGLAAKKRLSSKMPSMKEINNMTAEEFTDRLAALRNEPEEDKDSEEFISRREMKRMNRIENPVDFAKALDRMKWRG